MGASLVCQCRYCNSRLAQFTVTHGDTKTQLQAICATEARGTMQKMWDVDGCQQRTSCRTRNCDVYLVATRISWAVPQSLPLHDKLKKEPHISPAIVQKPLLA